MHAFPYFRSRPLRLLAVAMGLVAVHAILFYRLRHAGVPLAVVSGFALLVIVKHFGLIGTLPGLLRRRSRIRKQPDTLTSKDQSY